MIEFIYLQHCIIATIIGVLMGIERAVYQKNASIRTFGLLTLGSCVFTILSISAQSLSGITDPSRISAQIVSGIGFIGGGVILKNSNKIEGITTAAMIWFSAAMGMVCGFGYSTFALFVFVLYLFIVFGGIFLHSVIDKIMKKEQDDLPF